MYCAINEAFDNPIKKQFDDIRRLHSGGKAPPGSKEFYDAIAPQDDHTEMMFSAQGDLNKNKGTLLSDLHKQEQMDISLDDISYASYMPSTYGGSLASYDTISSISDETFKTFNDKTMSDNDSLSAETNKIKVMDKGHEYYIRKFINDIYKNTGKNNNMSDVYDHVSTCNYCKNEINVRTADYTEKTDKTNIVKKKKSNTKSKLFCKSNTKNIVIMFIIGVVMIAIIDLLLKVLRIRK